MERMDGLRIIRNIFPDELSVPYVPTVFRASNPPLQADVEVFKSDPPIPSSVEAKNKKKSFTRLYPSRLMSQLLKTIQYYHLILKEMGLCVEVMKKEL